MNKLGIILLLFTLVLSSCSKDYYQISSFKDKTRNHQKIAVLPVEMVFSGLKPFDLSDEEIQQQEEAESKAFQISLHNELLKRKENSKKGPHIQLMRTSQINKIIEEQMSIKDSWAETPEDMAKLLGVDAVLRSRVEKKRYFSDLASYGIDVASKLIGLLAKDIGIFAAGQSMKKSNDIYGRYELIEGSSEEILWSVSFEDAANYKNPAEEIINGLNEKAAKRFPYKKRK